MGEKHTDSQGTLWHDTVLDAVTADIYAAGGFKVVGPQLHPELEGGTAANRLRNAVNPDQPHKLDPQQLLVVMRLAREAGSFATMNYLGRELGCEVAVLSAPEAKKRVKKQRISALLAEVARLTADE